MELAGKVTVITGAASGIGRASSLRFASEGAIVIVADLDGEGGEVTAAEIRRAGGQALSIRCDVPDEVSVVALVEQTLSSFGHIDLFWSNAGISIRGGIEVPNEGWERAWKINVMPSLSAARAVLPAMVDRGSGYLLHTASSVGLLTHPDAIPYAVSKHAVIALAEWLAITYADKGIKVSCLCPKYVRTPMVQKVLDNPATAAYRERVYGAVLEPAQVAEMVVQALKEEPFLIVPNPDVLDDLRLKGTDYEGWIAAMRQLIKRGSAGYHLA